jgi:hypothetical protein
MPLATGADGDLMPIDDCFIETSGGQIVMKILPDISDTKTAHYQDQAIIGRSFPLKTYSHSENRVINWTIHLVVVTDDDLTTNLETLRTLESMVYPRTGNPYKPPEIATLQCGKLLATKPVCAVLKSYSVKFPTEVAWDEGSLCPYKFDIDTTWEVVYDSGSLPNADMIAQDGT